MKRIVEILHLNKVIWLLTFSDIFSWGLVLSITSIVGIYLSLKLGYNTIEIVGLGVAIGYLIRGIAQIPIGLITDNIKKDKDDLIVLVSGNLLMGLPFLFYPVIQSALAFYILQFVFGLGTALNLVTWRKMFAKNLDKNKEGLSYAIYDTIMSIAIAIFSFIGGILANTNQQVFDWLMIFIGILIMASGILPAMIFDVRNRRSKI